MGIAINAHYDGKVIVPDEPLDLPPNQPLVVRIESISENALAEESALTWIAENSCESPRLPSDLSHQHDHYLYGIPKNDLPATGPKTHALDRGSGGVSARMRRTCSSSLGRSF